MSIHTKWRIPPDVNNRADKFPIMTVSVMTPLKITKKFDEKEWITGSHIHIESPELWLGK